MNIGEILTWESSNLLLLIPVVIGLVMLLRWIQGTAVFAEPDWLLLLAVVVTMKYEPNMARLLYGTLR
jgi:hypothetical protein